MFLYSNFIGTYMLEVLKKKAKIKSKTMLSPTLKSLFNQGAVKD